MTPSQTADLDISELASRWTISAIAIRAILAQVRHQSACLRAAVQCC